MNDFVNNFKEKDEDDLNWLFVGRQKTTNMYSCKVPLVIKMKCPHKIDGAIKVAEYIVKEIQTNVKSPNANSIRYLNDYKGRRQEWQDLNLLLKIATKPPEPQLLAAMTLFAKMVSSGNPWDHKPLIRDNTEFNKVAVSRKLPTKDKMSYRYYHKYKDHDYFYDVWSNIHYGYVGLSVGFDEETLLWGADKAQWFDNKEGAAIDPPSDTTCVKIGFLLFKKFKLWAENLTALDILSELEKASDSELDQSRFTHICLENRND